MYSLPLPPNTIFTYFTTAYKFNSVYTVSITILCVYTYVYIVYNNRIPRLLPSGNKASEYSVTS